MWKFFLYRYTSKLSALNCSGGILFKCLSYLYEEGRTTFFADFRSFTIFDRNFAKIVAPPNNGNKSSLGIL